MIVLLALLVVSGAALALVFLSKYSRYLTSVEYCWKKLQNSSLEPSALVKIAKNRKVMEGNRILWDVVCHPNSTPEIMYEALKHSSWYHDEGFSIQHDKALEIIKYAGARRHTSEGRRIYSCFLSGHYPTKGIVDYVMGQPYEDKTKLAVNPQLSYYGERKLVELNDPSLLFLILTTEHLKSTPCETYTLTEGLLSPYHQIRELSYEKAVRKEIWDKIYEISTGNKLNPQLPDEWVERLAKTAYEEYNQEAPQRKLAPVTIPSVYL